MPNEEIDEELSQMYEEDARHTRVLDSSTFKKPIKSLRVLKPVTINSDRSVREAVELMQKMRFGCVAVTEEEKLVGIFTERDVLTKIAGKANLESLKVKDVMTPEPESFQPDDSIAFVLNAMHVGGYRHVPVIDEGGRPLAIVSVKDIVGFIIDHFAEDVLNLPPEPMRKTEQREGA